MFFLRDMQKTQEESMPLIPVESTRNIFYMTWYPGNIIWKHNGDSRVSLAILPW